MRKYFLILILLGSISNLQSQIDSVYKEVEKLIIDSNYTDVYKIIHKSLNDYPNDPQLHYYKGKVSLLNGYPKNAFDSFETSLGLDSSLYDSYSQIGDIYYQSILLILDKHINDFGPESEFKEYMEFVVYQLCLSSIPYYEKAYIINNQDSTLKQRLIHLYIRAGQYEKLKKIKSIE